jgi:tetratricopeptide (TPR) repeat protein
MAVASLAVITGLALLLPAGRAALMANAGAIRQARAELRAYDPAQFDRVTLDDARRRIDLERAVADLTRALAIEPGQPTASRRLAMIALARGDYEGALSLMETSWAMGHQDHPSRLLLADALVANGQGDRAFELLANRPGAAERLKSQAWYRYWTQDDFARARDAWTTAARLNPTDEEARRMADMADKRLSVSGR